MELGEAIRRRRMVRNFEDRPVPAEALERILDHARRAPSAGHTQGYAFLVLEGPEQVGRFWDCTFPATRRAGFRWPGLFRAPVVILPCASKAAYLDRYGHTGRAIVGLDPKQSPVPVAPLTRFRFLHESPVSPPAVRVFEYVGPRNGPPTPPDVRSVPAKP